MGLLFSYALSIIGARIRREILQVWVQIRYAAAFREDEAEDLGGARGFLTGIKCVHREMLSVIHWCFVPALLCAGTWAWRQQRAIFALLSTLGRQV